MDYFVYAANLSRKQAALGRWNAVSDMDYDEEVNPRYRPTARCEWCGGSFEPSPGATVLCDACHAKTEAERQSRERMDRR